MASFFLLNKQVLQFSETKHSVKCPYGVRLNSNSANINFLPVTHSAEKLLFVEKVLQRTGKPQMELNLSIAIMMPDAISPANDATGGIGIMRLEGNGENHILNQIRSMTHEKVTLSWVVSEFRELNEPEANGNPTARKPSFSWKTEGVQLNLSQSFLAANHCAPIFIPSYFSMREISNIPLPIITGWKSKKPFQGTFSVYIVISEAPLSYQIHRKNTAKCRKILEECIEPDVHLVSKEKRVIKCHRAMLAASSEKLANLLKTPNRSLQVSIMKHLSLECINALLPFIYHGDVSKVNTSAKFALEVLEAAIEFQLAGLVSHLERHLSSKLIHEFTVDDGVKLFVMAKSSSSENESGNNDENDTDDDTVEVGEGNSENDTETEDDSEPSVIWLGTTTCSTKRMRTEENENSARCNPVRQCRNSLAALRQNSANGKGTGVLVSDDQIPGTSAAMRHTEVFSNYKNSLEKQAIKIILWCLRNNSNALEESVEYHKLIGSPKLLLEISKIIIQSSQGSVHE